MSTDHATKNRPPLHITHGHSRNGRHTHAYSAWHAMHQRCRSSASHYYRYSGRGIIVCERWRRFENFLADMGEPPSPKHSLDRINGDGDYEPGNCRWATPKEQMRNMSRNNLLTWRGKTQTLVEWGEELGVKPNTLLYRLRRGWDFERAFTEPIHEKTKRQ